MEAIIELQDICKSYKTGDSELQVLKNISLTVAKGEFLSILGPSGSGKSTLMNVIGCMDSWDSGTYLLEDSPVFTNDEDSLSQIRNSKIGFVFQKYQLIPRYTIQQNVMLPLLIRGISWTDAASAAASQLEQVGLSDKLHSRPNQLSGGQQQRVAIARALITRPAVLLADEPTGALDSATGAEVLALFKELNGAGNTIVMITHDIGVAKNASRCVSIVDGVLQPISA
ncbi:MAG: ABC transporter ATP-binding protein [Angelakisella sp.]